MKLFSFLLIRKEKMIGRRSAQRKMKIRELLGVESIRLDGNAMDKTDGINQLVDLMVKSGKIMNVVEYHKDVFESEKECIIIGKAAILHGRSKVVSRPGIAVMLVREGITFHAEEKDRIYIFFLLAVPDAKDQMETELLNMLKKVVMDQRMVDSIKRARGKIEVLNLIEGEEQEDVVKEEN